MADEDQRLGVGDDAVRERRPQLVQLAAQLVHGRADPLPERGLDCGVGRLHLPSQVVEPLRQPDLGLDGLGAAPLEPGIEEAADRPRDGAQQALLSLAHRHLGGSPVRRRPASQRRAAATIPAVRCRPSRAAATPAGTPGRGGCGRLPRRRPDLAARPGPRGRGQL